MRREICGSRIINWITQEPGCAWIPETFIIATLGVSSGVHGWFLILPLAGLHAVVYIVLTYVRPDREAVLERSWVLNRRRLHSQRRLALSGQKRLQPPLQLSSFRLTIRPTNHRTYATTSS